MMEEREKSLCTADDRSPGELHWIMSLRHGSQVSSLRSLEPQDSARSYTSRAELNLPLGLR